MKKEKVTVELPADLMAKLKPLLKTKKLEIDAVIRLYLRSLVTASEKNAALELSSEMPLGKFKGEIVEVIIRTEPGYVSWLIGSISSFKLSPEALSVLEECLVAE